MAKKIQWDPSLAVGNPVIDEQHKILFDLANDLNNAVNLGSNKRVIDTLFSVIMDYSFKHFSAEEKDLEKSTEFEKHCYEHYQLLKQLHEYSVEYRNSRRVSEPPSVFLENWLASHIKKTDIPSFSNGAKTAASDTTVDKIDSFGEGVADKRQNKRVRYDAILDEDIISDCYNTTTLKAGNATVVDLSSGGLKIYSEDEIDIGDLLMINCRVGKNFRMNEKVKVKNNHENFYGVEFVSPSKDTVQFLTQLCGAVHRYGNS